VFLHDFGIEMERRYSWFPTASVPIGRKFAALDPANRPLIFARRRARTFAPVSAFSTSYE
jgi:hypothetical protein